MKAHKYWGIGAFVCMIVTMITGMKMRSKNAHKYWAVGTMICMFMAMFTGYRMIHRKPAAKTAEQVSDGDENSEDGAVQTFRE